jgi:hypothetical protein
VFRGFGDGDVRPSATQQDGLGANHYHGVTLFLPAPRASRASLSTRRDCRVIHGSAYTNSFSSIQDSSSSPSAGFRPGPASRSTATCSGDATIWPSADMEGAGEHGILSGFGQDDIVSSVGFAEASSIRSWGGACDLVDDHPRGCCATATWKRTVPWFLPRRASSPPSAEWRPKRFESRPSLGWCTAPVSMPWLHSEMLKTRVAHGYCARHERVAHTLNAASAWHLSKHWVNAQVCAAVALRCVLY